LLGFNVKLLFFVQWSLSVIAWFSFASLIYLLSGRRRMSYYLGIAILLISMQASYLLWINQIMTESLSVSFFLLLVVCFWMVLQKGSGRCWFWFVALLFFSLLSSQIRDSNAYLILLAALLWLVISLFKKDKRVFAVVYFVCAVLMFSYSSWTTQLGHRGAVSKLNVITLRVLHQPEAKAYFYQHGMPLVLHEQIMPKVLQSLLVRTFIEGTEANAKLAQQQGPGVAWVERHFSKVFLSYLLTHPRYQFAPFWHASFYTGWLLNGMLFAHYWHFPPQVSQSSLAAWLSYAYLLFVFSFIAIAFFLALAIFTKRKKGEVSLISKQMFWFGVTNVVLSLVMAWFIWQVGPMGIMRHQLLAYTQLLVGLFFVYAGRLNKKTTSRWFV
jgi:hypothetical protein